LLPWDLEDAEKAAKDRERIKRWQESERYAEKALRPRPRPDPATYADKLRIEECLGLVEKILSRKFNARGSSTIEIDDVKQELLMEAAKLIKGFRGDGQRLLMHLAVILPKRLNDILIRQRNTAGITGQPPSCIGRHGVYDEAAAEEYGEAETEEEKGQSIRQAGMQRARDDVIAIFKLRKRFVASRARLDRETKRIEAIDFEKGTRQWLSDSERHILRLRRMGLTTGEIAEAVKESQPTISRRLSEIWRKLQDHLGYLPSPPAESSLYACVNLRKVYPKAPKQPPVDPEQWHREHLEFWADIREGFKKNDET